MKIVVQRVTKAQVEVDKKIVGKIDNGFLVLLGIKVGDTQNEADYLVKKLCNLRVFTDENDKMNLSLSDVNGGVLVVSNFTLCAQCRKGRRPKFDAAAGPELAESLYEYFCVCMKSNGIEKVEKGIFGADMKVSLLNDGPVTIVIDTKELAL